jgi:hypothetical protein
VPGVLADPSPRRVLDRPVSVLHSLPLIPTRSVGLNSSTGREASRISDLDPQPQCLRWSTRSRLASPGERPGERGVAQIARRGFNRAPAEHGLGACPKCLFQVLVPSACPEFLSHVLPSVLCPRVLRPRVLRHAGPRATNCAGWQGARWGLRDALNQTMYCKNRPGKPLGQEGLIERKALVQSPRARSVNRVRSDEGVAWPVQGPIGLGTGPRMSQAGTAGSG